MIDPKDEDNKTSKELYDMLRAEYSDEDETLAMIDENEADIKNYPEEQKIREARQFIAFLELYW